MSDLDKILDKLVKYISDVKDISPFETIQADKQAVNEAKQAIQQELLKVRLDELQKLLFNSQLGVPDGWAASTMSTKDVKDRIAELQSQIDEVQPNE